MASERRPQKDEMMAAIIDEPDQKKAHACRKHSEDWCTKQDDGCPSLGMCKIKDA